MAGRKRLDEAWIAGQVAEFAAQRPRYQAYAALLRQLLEKAAEVHAPLAIVQARAKAVSSFTEKILRKQKKAGQTYDPVRQFTDLCGARVITLRRSEVEAVGTYIKSHFDVDWENSVDTSQRLRPTEFGYRSVHYIVSFRRGAFPEGTIPPELFTTAEAPMKAEVQVRTVLEHAWADLSHDLSYKSAFRIPQQWERQIARVAAALEDADGAFDRIHQGLQRYAASYGGYMSGEEREAEMALLGILLEHDRENPRLANRLGKLAITAGEWRRAVEAMEPHAGSRDPALLRDLGVALCRLHQDDRGGEAFRRGQQYLEQARELAPRDVDTLASLAGTWKGRDDRRAAALYREAYELDPADPYPLGNFIEAQIAEQRSAAVLSVMRPMLAAAVERCRDQVMVNVNMPWAYYNMAKFCLFLEQPYESLWAYSSAVRVSADVTPVELARRSVERLQAAIGETLPGTEWVRRFLLAAQAARSAPPRLEVLHGLAGQPIAGPVVIVVGGTDPSIEPKMSAYGKLLLEAFRGFRGTVISGGTTVGISGIVGEVARRYRHAVHSLAYLPRGPLPADAVPDARYKEVRRTDGERFSPLEPLQNWIDILASGINPAEVKVLGINGGRISATEYRMALALGARVGVVEESGREATRLLADDDWALAENLIRLPADAMTLRAFIGPGAPMLPAGMRADLARAIHERYVADQMETLRKQAPEWDALAEMFRESSAQQADHIHEKLRQIGCDIRPARGRAPALMSFTAEEIEIMAEMEHGRWNVERLLGGWRWGPKKDPEKKVSPYLVSWQELPDDIRDWDRKTVAAIPEFLARLGLEVYRP
jgi:ppGpp synthetase/RelA/SpoT-type nucleotidyltranferase/Flp pilus assembly protein TadD